MTQEIKYLTYNEYQALGGNIEKNKFDRLEFCAEKKVDKYTFNRFRKVKEYPNELKMCIYDLILQIENISQSDNTIASETVGSYSVTKKDTSELEVVDLNIITNYLQNTRVNNVPVLYRGADINDN